MEKEGEGGSTGDWRPLFEVRRFRPRMSHTFVIGSCGGPDAHSLSHASSILLRRRTYVCLEFPVLPNYPFTHTLSEGIRSLTTSSPLGRIVGSSVEKGKGEDSEC